MERDKESSVLFSVDNASSVHDATKQAGIKFVKQYGIGPVFANEGPMDRNYRANEVPTANSQSLHVLGPHTINDKTEARQ